MAEELTPALQAKLAEYQKALESEFDEATAGAAEGEDFEALIRETFKAHSAAACARIVWLAHNAESEAVQSNCAKFIIGEAFKAAVAESDPIRVLISELTANDATAAPATDERTAAVNKASKK